MRIAVATIVAALLSATPVAAASTVPWMVELTLEGQKVEGTPLAWNARSVHLLGRDGRLWEFPPDDATDFHRTSSRFRSYSISELRAALLRELGNEFEVSGTGHYLVAHPRGQRDRWAQRFEDLYRSFVHYFSVRGLKPTRPPFPLIGVVCKDRHDFRRRTAQRGMAAPTGVLGFYALDSNQIVLYDMEAEGDSQHWQRNASVIIHEAAHQTAFNTGVHNRYAPPPLWVAEGLATMFEAPGLYDSRHYHQRGDRINRGRLQAFRRLVVPHHQPKLPAAMVASDELFRSNPAAAYAEAWALSFYLAETRPRKYTKYLAMTAKRPAFVKYTGAERTADFTSVFGDDWRMLEARFLRFMAELD